MFKSKLVYDIILPVILSILTVALAVYLGKPLAIHEHPGLTKNLLDLLALLIAFYMAALAAVATFDRAGLDTRLRGGDAVLRVWDNATSDWRQKLLTYREFISYLFGYLSFASLVLFGALLFLTRAWPVMEGKIVPLLIHGEQIFAVGDAAVFCTVFFAIWQLIITSMLGIYFLSERIQTLNDGPDLS